MDSKRFYWIKLKKDFFDQEAFDLLMSQEDGSDYVLIYLMLCIKTMNTKGALASQIGDVLVKFTPEKIARDLKYFSVSTIVVALKFFTQLGLIYEENNGVLILANVDEMIGSECPSAERMRKHRELKKLTSHCDKNVTQEYRDKSIEYRDKITEKDIEKDNEENSSFHSEYSSCPELYEESSSPESGIPLVATGKRIPKKVTENPSKRFIPPTIDEVSAYCRERNNSVDPERFVDFYESKGWLVGKSKMKDWRAAVRNWEKSRTNDSSKPRYAAPDVNPNQILHADKPPAEDFE